MIYRNISCAFGLAFFLSACGTVQGAFENPVVVSANSSTITYSFRTGHLGEAQGLANTHCAMSGRMAQMDRVMPDKTNFSSAIFNCV